MKEMFIKEAFKHNFSVDKFINVELRKHFQSDKVNAEQWFEAQRLINEQNFYEKGKLILRVLRSYGIDCKINCQSNKLVCPEINLFDC